VSGREFLSDPDVIPAAIKGAADLTGKTMQKGKR
jgi:hypothetical protein